MVELHWLVIAFGLAATWGFGGMVGYKKGVADERDRIKERN